jgi:hypothetical protein
VDKEENERDHEPDYGQGVEDALEESSQFSVLGEISTYFENSGGPL